MVINVGFCSAYVAEDIQESKTTIVFKTMELKCL